MHDTRTTTGPIMRKLTKKALLACDDAADRVEDGDFGEARAALIAAAELVLALIDAEGRPTGGSRA